MRELVEQAGKPDVAVIDPPRAGLSQKVVRRIIEAAPAAHRLRLLQPDDARAERGAARRGGLDAQARAAGRHVPADAAHRVRRAARARVSVHRVARMFGMVNAFLVEEDDGLTLIDTAIGGRDAKAILAEASKLGRPIVRIALTHAHQDHIGGLDALAAELPGVEVLISTRDAKLLAKDTTPEPGEPADAKLRGGYSGAKTKPDPPARARRPRRLARGRRRPRPHAGPDRVHGHPRPHADRRRRVLDPRRRRHDGEAQPALPDARARDLAPPDGARDRPRPARPRPGPPRGRPRPDRRRTPAPRWTRRSPSAS